MSANKTRSPFTAAVHAGQKADPEYGGLSVPIYQSSTFAFKNAEHGAALFEGRGKGYIYTRLGNPTIKALEDSLTELEGGTGALAAATGMAAVTTVYMTLLGQGAHLVSTDSCYSASRALIETEFARFGVAFDYVDTTNPENVRRALRPETRLLWLDTPSNPTLAVSDIRACAALAHERGALVAVDNTFSSPILQNPLALGADIVVHSATKAINGHCDVVGGIIVVADEALFARLQKTHRLLGGTMDPHQAWLVLRGVKTLAMRVEKAQDNAMRLAPWFAAHPRVAWVNYPGLPSHPQHALAGTQMKGFGSMICFGLKGGYAAAKRLMDAVRLATLAVSLGGVDTLIEHPASMTHHLLPEAERKKAGVADDLIRLSVGCEAFEDLAADFERALEEAA